MMGGLLDASMVEDRCRPPVAEPSLTLVLLEMPETGSRSFLTAYVVVVMGIEFVR
jgi:hypothetical protein